MVQQALRTAVFNEKDEGNEPLNFRASLCAKKSDPSH
jgi:hypothetical protein